MKRILLSFCLLAFIALNVVFSQGKLNVDSLTAVLNQYPKEDTVKVKMLIALSEALIGKNVKEGIAHSNKAFEIVEKFNAPKLVADALYTKARHLELSSKYDEALKWAKKALGIYEQLHSTKRITEVYNLLGRIYYDKQDDENTKKHYEHALLLSEQIGDMKNKIISLAGLGSLYAALNDFTKSFTYVNQALELAEKHHYPELAALAASNLGNKYFKQGNFIKALEYTQKALRIDESLGDANGLIYDYNDLGNIYLQLPEPEKALEYFNKALQLAIKMGAKEQEAASHERIGVCYLTLKKYKEAALSIEKSIATNKIIGNMAKANSNLLSLGSVYAESKQMLDAHRCFQEVLEATKKSGNQYVTAGALINIGQIYVKEPDSLLSIMGINPTERYEKTVAIATEGLEISTKINSLSRIAAALAILSTIHEYNKDYTKAYDFYKRYIAIKDSISGDDVKKQITRKEIQYEFDKKETELKYQQQLTANELEKQRLLTFQQGQTLTLKEQALALSNKEKDLAHLAFLKEQAEKQEKEQALLLAQKDKDLTGVQLLNLAKEKALQLQEIARKNATIGFLGASVLAILLAAALFYLWLKKRQAQVEAARQAELQAAFTQQLFAETEAERARIARDLHDGISHELLGLKRTSLPSSGDAAQKIDGVIESIRQISRNLHPVMLDSIGLQLSIESFCEQFAEAHNLYVNYEINYSNELHKNTELQVLRIIQEALTNAAKHANAQAANVSMSNYGNGVLLKIQDNGKGFDVEKALNSGKAFGLQSIIERAKIINTKANIYSTPQGTIIELKIN